MTFKNVRLTERRKALNTTQCDENWTQPCTSLTYAESVMECLCKHNPSFKLEERKHSKTAMSHNKVYNM